MKRLVSLDFLRGIAIFSMCIVHIWLNVFDTSVLNEFSFDSINPVIIIVGGLIFLLGHFRSFFLMISAIGHQYTMELAHNKGISEEIILKRKVIAGLLVYFLGIIREGIFNPWGILDNVIYSGQWNWNELTLAYLFETLQMIGIGTVLLAILQYIIWKVQKKEKIKQEIIIFSILAGLIIFISPPIHNQVNLFFGFDMEHQFTANLNTFWDYLTRFFWVMIAAKEEPIFPFFATVLIGGIVGKTLNIPRVSKTHLNRLHGAGIGLIIAGGLHWIIIDNFSFDIWFHIHPTWFFLINSGVQLNLVLLFLRMREFNPKIDHKKWLIRTRFFRRWGRISLTIYMLQIIEMIPRYICWKIFNINCYTRGNLNWNWTILMIIICMAFYELVVTLWEQIHFIGTWEWLSIKIKMLGTNKTEQRRIDLLDYIDNIEPIQFIDKKKLELSLTPGT